jgi:hypothetical protein
MRALIADEALEAKFFSSYKPHKTNLRSLPLVKYIVMLTSEGDSGQTFICRAKPRAFYLRENFVFIAKFCFSLVPNPRVAEDAEQEEEEELMKSLINDLNVSCCLSS